MKQQITRFSLVQTAKVMAALYFVLGLVGAVVMLCIAAVSPARSQGLVFILLTPLFYAFFGFVFAFIGCWLYNAIARFVGGIEFELTESRDF
jgi:uncharacterized membrane protein YeaQ/YmgE (transglycosylase-associated protein family)